MRSPEPADERTTSTSSEIGWDFWTEWFCPEANARCVLTLFPSAVKSRQLGFAIKIDTNGTRPSVVKSLVEEGLCDYIALDYKAPAEQYGAVTGRLRPVSVLFQNAGLSDCLKIPFEVRTTVHPDLLTEDHVNTIIRDLTKRGYEGNYFVQNFYQTTQTLNSLPTPDRPFDRSRVDSSSLPVHPATSTSQRKKLIPPHMFDILLNHNTLVLFGIIFFGIALGSIKIYGLNLGLSGVLFVALAAGHYRLAIPNGVGQLGLALFVYCVGLSAGNRFFSAIAKQGSKLAVMSAVIVGVSALFTCLCGIWFNVPAGISSGIFAGPAPALALVAATESPPGASGSGVSIGYGIAYPFGVVGVVLFVQLLPRLLHFDLHKEARAMHAKQEASIISRLVRVNQPNLLGQNIADCKLLDGLHCMVTRVVRDGRLMPLTPEDTFREGTEVLIVGNSDTMPHDIAFLGEACENPYPMDSQKERRKLILTNKDYAGRKLRDLKPSARTASSSPAFPGWGSPLSPRATRHWNETTC